MLKPIFVAMLLVAAPCAAFAQSNTSPGSTSAARPAPTGNLNNPQAQSNMAGQPSIAHTVPSDGDAKSIPTPVIDGSSSSKIPEPEKPPTMKIR